MNEHSLPLSKRVLNFCFPIFTRHEFGLPETLILNFSSINFSFMLFYYSLHRPLYSKSIIVFLIIFLYISWSRSTMTHWWSSYIFSLAFTANLTYLATTPTPNLYGCAAIDLVESRSVLNL